MIESRIVEAACGECQFSISGKGCDLAVRQARVSGEVRDGRFVATAFDLLP